MEALDLAEVKTAPRSPWQNPYVERVIGTIRRECLDHIVPVSEQHVRRTLCEFAEYYNETRAHQSLNGNAPEPRAISANGELIAKPVLGGLHHSCSRAAA